MSMVLDPMTRGVLEKIIDFAIVEIPEDMKLIRAMKAVLHVSNEADFVFGQAWARIIVRFGTYYTAIRGRQVDVKEIDEVVDIIMKRASEIRDAIFRTG